MNIILSPKIQSDSERTRATKIQYSNNSQNSAKSSKVNSIHSLFSDSDSYNEKKSINQLDFDKKIITKPIIVKQSISYRQKSCSVKYF